jgi:hypothetical protein
MTRSRATAAFALLALAAAPFAGCGGDEEEAAKRPRGTPTERTEPRTATVPAAAPQVTEPIPTPPPADDPASAPAPEGERDGRAPATPYGGADGPRNDTPPPAGSPAERFEQECEANPSACG